MLSLSAADRYAFFVTEVADKGEAWGLWQNGWALGENDAGHAVFPLWPTREHAEVCAFGGWSGYLAVSIPVDDLLDIVLPDCRQKGLLPGVFYTPAGRGVIPDIDALFEDLDRALTG